jgi:hypothetical protein
VEDVPEEGEVFEEEAEVVEEGTAVLVLAEVRVGHLEDRLLEFGQPLFVALVAVHA